MGKGLPGLPGRGHQIKGGSQPRCLPSPCLGTWGAAPRIKWGLLETEGQLGLGDLQVGGAVADVPMSARLSRADAASIRFLKGFQFRSWGCAGWQRFAGLALGIRLPVCRCPCDWLNAARLGASLIVG